MKKNNLEFIALGIVTFILAGVITFALTKSHATNSSSSSSTSKLSPSQNKNKTQNKLNQLALPQLSKTVSDNESEVILHTTDGNITIKLFNDYAPLAVYNFMALAKRNYYTNTIFHRVIKNFMIQGGDPKGDGTGGHSIWYKEEKNTSIDSGNGFANEISSSLYNLRGSLAMANAGSKSTNGSQFFINQNSQNQSKNIKKSSYPTAIYKAYKHGGNPGLDGDYTVFGQVISGMTTVDKIAKSPVTANSSDENSTPKNPVKITSVEIVKDVAIDISAVTDSK